ncbi:hypothetical protein Marpi_1477 [Marinitoga piezophila KA3]|uniref:Uncharacterized protein n=1 Tax=Marinitoga piezophila (strain DSM 14283 / JCM 11233 / KA3) TaxID=443254 RepID=H2J457_MARPK|nr:hypothetical protein [Marinitoga piezophila]AEX85872.1 hypothetical protein Marpi_1477 [Marinitoga piezophila KA3]
MKKLISIILIGILATLSFGEFYVQPYFNTVSENGQDYLLYSINGVFENDSFGLGLGLNAYQKEIGGSLYYGTPNMEETDNILSGLTINLLKLRIGPLYFRYGISYPKTAGLGILMYNYTNNFKNALDLGFINEDIKAEVHMPYSLDSIIPVNYSQSGYLYYGILKTHVGFINLEFFGGKTMEKEDIKPLRDDVLGSVSAYLGEGILKIGGEAGYISSTIDSTTVNGYGAGAGGILNLGIITLKSLPVVIQMPYYKLGFVNVEYENNLENPDTAYDILNYDTIRFGGINEIDIHLGNIINANGRLHYDLTKTFEVQNPEITGSLYAQIPSEEFPLIIIGKYYRPMESLEDINNWLDKNTSAEISVGYPVSNNLFMLYTKYYDSFNDEFKDKIEFSVINEF